MRVVVQRVSSASVTIDGVQTAAIDTGLLVLVGIEESDAEEDAAWLSAKISGLRIFGDENGIMNFSLKDIDGGIIVVSQFTLHALTKKGNRPSYIKAARPEKAIPLYQYFIDQLEAGLGKRPGTGIFGADMKVALINDGPVTILMDSKNKS
ncbi:MAG: D-tyrosyl-tRNA(Tyr) deacylase [Flavobacterium sp. BFFFF1]|uniref:D-aminoacyl-tRNA deacylase n=1 Tax=Flavobacterium sp. BFFFF1 TaxID=2015557 RepID=UPI000BD94C74|nr:D-aminoacyl-tRNA deacylase [Flavobacterium sp. BFFFF1]OYU79798.1 MAG: D-tyrosyl-tRNA(Tyr) deacylase [Flavobacterium sp. BFFFF1]